MKIFFLQIMMNEVLKSCEKWYLLMYKFIKTNKSGVSILKFFIRHTFKTWNTIRKRGTYFWFDFGWYSVHFDIGHGSMRALLNRDNQLIVTEVLLAVSYSVCGVEWILFQKSFLEKVAKFWMQWSSRISKKLLKMILWMCKSWCKTIRIVSYVTLYKQKYICTLQTWNVIRYLLSNRWVGHF